MIPSIPLRLDGLIKSMELVILPSIDEHASMAQEQAALLIKHLKIIQEQCNSAHIFELGSLKEMVSLAGRLLEKADGGEETSKTSQKLSTMINHAHGENIGPIDTITQQIIKVGERIEALIAASYKDGSDDFKAMLTSSVLEYGRTQSYRERIWFKSCEMDPDASTLPSLQELFS